MSAFSNTIYSPAAADGGHADDVEMRQHQGQQQQPNAAGGGVDRQRRRSKSVASTNAYLDNKGSDHPSEDHTLAMDGDQSYGNPPPPGVVIRRQGSLADQHHQNNNNNNNNNTSNDTSRATKNGNSMTLLHTATTRSNNKEGSVDSRKSMKIEAAASGGGGSPSAPPPYHNGQHTARGSTGALDDAHLLQKVGAPLVGGPDGRGARRSRANSGQHPHHIHQEHADPLATKEEREDEANAGKIRRINVLQPESHTDPPFADNYIKTTKYTLNPFSTNFFIFKNLFEQFQRKANLYFLIIGCLQLIPGVSPTGQFTTLMTLLAVMAFSMLKSGYEDYERFLKDSEVNSKVAYVLRQVPVAASSPSADPNNADGVTKKKKGGAPPSHHHHDDVPTVPRFVQVKYTEIRVGDIVRVLNVDPAVMAGSGGGADGSGAAAHQNDGGAVRNNALPCDLMLLSSADPEGAAFVETSNLDGETNLKPRFCIDQLRLDGHNSNNTKNGGGEAAMVGMLGNTLSLQTSGTVFASGVGGNTPSAPNLMMMSGATAGAHHHHHHNDGTDISAFMSADFVPMGLSTTATSLQQQQQQHTNAINNNTNNNAANHANANALMVSSWTPQGSQLVPQHRDDGNSNATANHNHRNGDAAVTPSEGNLLLFGQSLNNGYANNGNIVGVMGPSAAADAASTSCGALQPTPSYAYLGAAGGSAVDGEVATTGANSRQQRSSTAQQCWQRYHGCRIECEVPNGHLYTFTGTFTTTVPAVGGGGGGGGQQQSPPRIAAEKYAITPAQMLYRGTNLRKVAWVVGVCVNTGRETKVMMNARSPPHKSSRVESLVNYLLIAVLILQAILVLVCAIVITVQPEDEWYLGNEDQGAGLTFVLGVITFAILFNNLIPISLYVSMEMIKFLQGRLMEWDVCMYYSPKDMRATAKTTDLNEELGQINYIFSDKTGTLTCNVMTFMKFCCKGVVYGTGITEIGKAAAMRKGLHVVDTRSEEVLKSDFPFYDERISDDKWWTDPNAEAFRDLFTVLAVCHTVVIDQGRFEAESPDEEALVKAAKALGIKFASRSSDAVTLEVGTSGIEETITILDVIPFDSDRKRMSCLVKLPKGQGYRLFTKGADNVMLPRMAKTSTGGKGASASSPSFEYEAETLAALQQFGDEGLRVLVLGSKVIPAAEAQRWSAEYRAARGIIGDDARRDALITELAARIECDMSLVGVTAIEDKLQDGVPQAMEAFRKGGIKVWMLTGDKIETAINIGYACSLLFTDCRLSTFFGTVDETTLLGSFAQEMVQLGDDTPHSVVIDGDALGIVLADEDLREGFYQMVKNCVSVVCCRVSPKQKAMVVNLIREKESSCVSLAVGDGANDVPMIQSAHVGVGISGMEGQQAANAADYSVGQFRFLQRLLMVHGRVNYHRLALTINYFFYKNALLVMTQFWFCIFNRFTGQSLYEKWTLSCYNLVFTSLPVIIVGSLDRDILNTDNIIALPQLYRAGLEGQYLNVKVFIRWLVNAVVHSAIIFFVVMFGWNGDGVNKKGTTGGLDTTGLTMMSVLVAVANCKLALHANSFSWVQHVFIWGTILFFYFFCAVMGALPTSFSTIMYGNVQNILTFTTPWLFYFLTAAIALLPDLFIMYIGYNWFYPTIRMIVQYADSKDPMASIRPPAEVRRKKAPVAGASVLTTYSLLTEANNNNSASPTAADAAAGPNAPLLAGGRRSRAVSVVKLGDQMTKDLYHLNPDGDNKTDGANKNKDADGNNGLRRNGVKDAKQALFAKAGRDEDDDIDVSQGVFMGFIDTEIEDEFLVGFYGNGFRYKFALGMCAIVSILLFAVAVYSTLDDDGDDDYIEPVMWGVSSLVCWIGFLIVTCFKSLDLRGRLHPVILTLTIVMFSCLSVANLLASQRDDGTHPVTMATIMLGLITVLRPPFFHGLQYSLVAIASFVGFSFAVKVDEWTNMDIAVRAVEIFVVIVTAMIALAMSENFSRKMFISQLQARIASKAARREENRSLVLLGNVLPSAIVFEVRTNNHKLNQFSLKYDLASTLNSDIVKFTNFSSTKEPHVVVEMLNKMFTLFDYEAKLLGLEKIKTIGDAYVCAGGVPAKDDLHQEKILFMGIRMLENIVELNRQGLTTLKDLNIQIRVGVATGSVSAGVVGMQKVCYEVFGECAEKSELMEQTGLPSRVHVHSEMINSATNAVFKFDIINGEYFVAGLHDHVDIATVFGSDYLEDSVPSDEPKGLPEAVKSHMELNRNDIYSFLEDEDIDRRTTIKLWGNFQGEMKFGILNFRNDLAESEFRHYARLLSMGRFTPEVAQGTYLFLATTLLFALYFESIVKALTLVCLVIGATHLVIFVGNLIYSFLRKRRVGGFGSASSSAGGSHAGTSLAGVGGTTTQQGGVSSAGANTGSAAFGGGGGNISDDDEVDGANAMAMIQMISKQRRGTIAPTNRPSTGTHRIAVPTLQPQPQHEYRGVNNNTTNSHRVHIDTGTNTTDLVTITATTNNNNASTVATVAPTTVLVPSAMVINNAEENESFNAEVDGAEVGAADALPLCTPARFFALVSGTAALVMPVVAFYVFDRVSVVNVFVILSAQCYVLTMLHVRILFKFVLSIVHLAIVVGSFFYATMVNDDSFVMTKDGGNIVALALCYLLNFISAYITEQNVRRNFAAAKNLLYQNAETASSIALCDKILNNVLPKSIVQRMKEFPDRQIVDEVPDASVLFVYTDGLKHEHHAHRQKVNAKRAAAAAASASSPTGSVAPSMDPHGFSDSHNSADGAGVGAGNAPEVIDSMNTFLWILDAITVKYGVEKIKTAPFLVVSGCPERRNDHPERLAMVAMEIIAAVRQFNQDTGSDFKIKIGIHSGRVTAGVLGSTKFLYDVFGDTVNFASRLTSSAAWGSIQLSAETAERLRVKGFKVENKGTMELKGKGIQQIFLLKGKKKFGGGAGGAAANGGVSLAAAMAGGGGAMAGRSMAMLPPSRSNSTTYTSPTHNALPSNQANNTANSNGFIPAGGAAQHSGLGLGGGDGSPRQHSHLSHQTSSSQHTATTTGGVGAGGLVGGSHAGYSIPVPSPAHTTGQAVTTHLPGALADHHHHPNNGGVDANNTSQQIISNGFSTSVLGRDFGGATHDGPLGGTVDSGGGGGGGMQQYGSGVFESTMSGVYSAGGVARGGHHHHDEEDDDDDDEVEETMFTNMPTVADLNRTLQVKREREMMVSARSGASPGQGGLLGVGGGGAGGGGRTPMMGGLSPRPPQTMEMPAMDL